jgi:serine/threonine protein kinase
VQELAERAYFALCRAFGALLRAGKYAQVRIIQQGGAPVVRKVRRRYARLLIRLGDPLFTILGTGVRVLPRREWEGRERLIYRKVYDASIGVAADGALILPYLAGATLAAVLDEPLLAESERRSAIEWAVSALAAFHRLGLTHGDAMAENVLIDREAGVARWFDCETLHDPRRPLAWRRADDLRALLATCLLRTAPEHFPATIRLIMDTYADDAVSRDVTASVASVWRRPLTFHLAQAGLCLASFREIARLLGERGDAARPRPTR